MVAIPSLDVLAFVPKELKIIAAIALFMYAGSFIIEGMKFIVNLFIGSLNATNGCLNALGIEVEPALCIEEFQGLVILGINLTDFWVITALIFFPTIAFFAIKWYGMILNRG